MNAKRNDGLHVQGAGRQNSSQNDFKTAGPLYHQPMPGSRTAVVLARRRADRRAAFCGSIYVTPPDRAEQLLKIFRARSSTDGDTQKTRLILALRSGPVTTLEARRYLDVMAVSARVADLHKDGFAIVTDMVLQASDLGRTRLIGRYVLVLDGVAA